jgi:hypothetical protein
MVIENLEVSTIVGVIVANSGNVPSFIFVDPLAAEVFLKSFRMVRRFVIVLLEMRILAGGIG